MPFGEPKYQNSAGRLLNLLNSLSAGQPFIEHVPRFLGEKGETIEEKQQACLLILIEIHKLYVEFRQDMLDAEISEQQRNVLLSGLSSLQQALYPIQLNIGFRALTDAEKSLLEVCATIIPQEQALDKDDLEKIQESIVALRKQIESGNISPTLRNVLLELIRLSEDAIARFNIRGARGLRKAFKAMLAEAAEAYGLISGDGKRDEIKKSTAWQIILNHLRTIDNIAAKLLKYKPLLEDASKLLLGGPPS